MRRRCGKGFAAVRPFVPVPANSLEDSDNLPVPGVLAAEIVEELPAALDPLRLSAEALGRGGRLSGRGAPDSKTPPVRWRGGGV